MSFFFSSNVRSFINENSSSRLAVSQILDSLEDTQWLTVGDRVEVDFLQKLFEDKQLRTLLEVNRSLRKEKNKTHSRLTFILVIRSNKFR